MTKYDYLVVGAGLFGAMFAHEAALRGKRVKVIEKRDHLAGNIYTKEEHGIQVHQFGPIFSIRQIKKFGNTCNNLLNLTATLTVQWLITMGRCITYHLT